MKDRLYKLWRDYNLSIVLAGLFLVSWILQALTGWMKFSAEQAQHAQSASVFGKDGYIWEFAAATFENWQSEFLQLFSMVVLTAILIHRGSAESRDSNDRMEAKIDRLERAITELSEEGKSATRGRSKTGSRTEPAH
jgi:hypothetical protein